MWLCLVVNKHVLWMHFSHIFAGKWVNKLQLLIQLIHVLIKDSLCLRIVWRIYQIIDLSINVLELWTNSEPKLNCASHNFVILIWTFMVYRWSYYNIYSTNKYHNPHFNRHMSNNLLYIILFSDKSKEP